MEHVGRICFVSEDADAPGSYSGLGLRMTWLAETLASGGQEVDFLVFPPENPTPATQRSIKLRLLERGLRPIFIDPDLFVHDGTNPEKRAYSVYKYLAERPSYRAIHFHDRGGLGFYAIAARIQGLDFGGAAMVLHAQEPTRHRIKTAQTLFTSSAQLRVDFMERYCFRNADAVICPSISLRSWLEHHGYIDPGTPRLRLFRGVTVAPDVEIAPDKTVPPVRRGDLATYLRQSFRKPNIHLDVNGKREIFYFGELDDRRGFVAFCEALTLLADELAASSTRVSLIGPLGTVGDRPAGLFLTMRANHWQFPLRVMPGVDWTAAAGALRSGGNALVVLPGSVDDLSPLIMQALTAEVALVADMAGAVSEIAGTSGQTIYHAELTGTGLAHAIRQGLSTSIRPPAPRRTDMREAWLALEQELAPVQRSFQPADARPRVVLGITHFERPAKLVDAIASALRQTYDNLEIVVLDDGSRDAASREFLAAIEPQLNGAGGRIIRSENIYLGAARNRIASETQSDFLIFLDDDDLAFADMVETLVKAASATQAEIIGCLNLHMPQARRHEALPRPESFRQKLDYAPLGGPLSVSAFENWLGAATALIKRDCFEKLGGYSELRDVGFEDYELYFRAVQAGYRIEIVPRPLYLYEVGRPSMRSSTSTLRNYRRVLDAIEVGANLDAWSDAVNLATGRKAFEEATHLLATTLGSVEDRARERLLAPQRVGLESHLDELSQYALSLNAATIAVAWTEAKAATIEVGRSFASPVHSEPTSTNQVGLMFDLKLGRAADAVATAIAIIDRAGVIDASSADMLRILATHPSQDRKTLQQLLDDISHRAALPSAELGLILARIVIAFRLDRREQAREEAIALLREDEAEYLQQNYEVRDAVVRQTILTSGIQHYRRHGHAERRPGYARSWLLCKDLYAAAGVDAKPWTLGALLDLHDIREWFVD